VASDSALAGMVPYQNSDVTKAYILSVLADTLFTLAFHHALKTPNVDSKILKHVLYEHVAQFDESKSLVRQLDLAKWTGINEAEG
jgi:hypothetical protein